MGVVFILFQNLDYSMIHCTINLVWVSVHCGHERWDKSKGHTNAGGPYIFETSNSCYFCESECIVFEGAAR